MEQAVKNQLNKNISSDKTTNAAPRDEYRTEYKDPETQKWVIRKDVGRATGLYRGAEYSINHNAMIDDTTEKGDILAESFIAYSTIDSKESQNGKAVNTGTESNPRYADLDTYSSNNYENFGNYNTRYKLNYKVSDFRIGADSSNAQKDFKIKFSSHAKNGRKGQAAFRGTINIYLKDKDGN